MRKFNISMPIVDTEQNIQINLFIKQLDNVVSLYLISYRNKGR